MCWHVHRLGLLAFGQFSLWDLWNLNSRLTTKLDRLDRQTFGLVWVCAFVHQTTSPVANQPFACKRACNAMSKTWNYGTITTEDSVPGWLKGNTQANKQLSLKRLKGKNRVGVVWLCAWEHKKSDSSLRSRVSCKLHSVHCKAIA